MKRTGPWPSPFPAEADDGLLRQAQVPLRRMLAVQLDGLAAGDVPVEAVPDRPPHLPGQRVPVELDPDVDILRGAGDHPGVQGLVRYLLIGMVERCPVLERERLAGFQRLRQQD